MNNEGFLKLYTVEDDYIQDLQTNIDVHVFANIHS